MREHIHNPKLEEHPGSNAEKDPEDWISGDDSMTGAQASYLTTLCEQAKIDPPRDDLRSQGIGGDRRTEGEVEL